MDRKVLKFKVERLVGRYVANPAVAALDRVGVRTALMAELETTGRKTGLPRRVPVGVALDPEGAWLISQHGTRSGWVVNILADPRVRLRQGDVWRTGTAVLVPGDDVPARARTFAGNKVVGALTALTFRALQSDPVSVRVTFTDR